MEPQKPNVHKIWDEIRSGYKVVTIDKTIAVFRFLDRDKQNRADLLKSCYLQRIGSVVFSENDLSLLLKEKHVWGSNEEQRIADLFVILDRMQKHEGKVGYKGSKTRTYQNELISLINRRELYKKGSLEKLSNEFMVYISLFFGCEFVNGPLWKDFDSFLLCRIDETIKKLLSEWLVFQEGYSVDAIRQVCVDSFIYSLWQSGQKACVPLFDTTVDKMNVNQRNMCIWLNYYGNAFENFGRPETLILEDNKRFDSWLDTKIKERDKGFETPKKGSKVNKRSFKVVE